MENYKKKLKKRLILFGILSLLAAAVAIIDIFALDAFQRNDNILCFLVGLIAGVGFLSVAQIFRYRRIIHDEVELQKRYNYETDERMKEIRRRSGMPLIGITSALMIFAGILIGHINFTVFVALVIAAMAQMMIVGIVKIYYMKKL